MKQAELANVIYKCVFIFLAFLLATNAHSSSVGELFTYEINGKTYEGYYISERANAPLVLLIHDWDGLTDYEVKRANMLTELGYAVLAADLFGKGVRPTEVEDKRQHTGALYKDRNKMRALLQGALNEAEKKGANTNKAVAMGYCFGGAAVLELARSGADLKGFITFHGGLQTPDAQNYQNAKGKILILHGTADSHITMEHFAALANELEQAKVDHEMISYGGAPHAFTVFGSSSYRQEVDEKSWARFLTFLQSELR